MRLANDRLLTVLDGGGGGFLGDGGARGTGDGTGIGDRGQRGKGGGYVLGPSHWIQAGTPPDNIVAMFDEAVAHRPPG